LSQKLFEFFSTNDELFTYQFPDQDLLANFFSGKWKLIAWYWNGLRTLRSIHPDVWSDEEVRCIHYILSDKPWLSRKNPDPNARHFGILHEWWWQSFDEMGETMKLADAEGWKLVLKHVDVQKNGH
jgi:lipopolysaccharide biosynthesis glycosyltransferase